MNSQTLRVLLAEDGIAETGLTLRALCARQGRGLELVFVSNASRLFNILLQSQPHVAFLSLSMLQPDPPLAVSLLRRAAPHIPLILFVRPADKDCAVRCLQAGAENYMLEGFLDVPTLDYVLQTAIQGNVSAAIPGAKSRLHFITNLPNRSGLLHQLQKSSQESVLSGSHLLISVHFSNVGKLRVSIGPSELARVLRQVTQQLRSLIRRSDLLAYVASGVFVLAIFEARDGCRALLQRRIERRLLTAIPARPGGFPLEFSVRISSWDSATAISFPQLLAHHLSSKNQPSLPPPVPSSTSASLLVARSGP